MTIAAILNNILMNVYNKNENFRELTYSLVPNRRAGGRKIRHQRVVLWRPMILYLNFLTPSWCGTLFL